MPTKTITANQVNTSHQSFDAPDKRHKGAGNRKRMVAGRVESDLDLKFRSFVKFDFAGDDFWDDVKSVTGAYIRLTYAGGDILSTGSASKTAAVLITEAWDEGSSETFVTGEYIWPSVNNDFASVGDGGTGLSGDTTDIPVTESLRQIAPARVGFPLGRKGLGKANRGWALRGAPERTKAAAAQYWTDDADSPYDAPTLYLEYEKVNTAPIAGLDAWPFIPNDPITGSFTDEDSVSGDRMTRLKVEVKKTSEAGWGTLVAEWNYDLLTPNSAVTMTSDTTWSALIPNWYASIPSGVSHTPRVRVWDNHNEPSEWEVGAPFTITKGSGTITPNEQTLSTGNNLVLMATFEADEGLSDHESWLYSVTVADSETGQTLWTTTYPATNSETLNNRIECRYDGPAILKSVVLNVTYTVSRAPGLESFTYSSNSVTIVIVPGEEPVEEGETPTTGFSREVPAQRIIIRGMDPASRGPLGTLAIIEDFSNLGVSWYASAPGELYFTLPVSHPQVSVIEPMVTHYEYQQYRAGKWRSLAHGLIRDFDANERDIVFYGIDYLGLLSWTVEAAYQPINKPRKDMPSGVQNTNGSRYLKKTIKHIIVSQLERARKQNDYSPVRFIETGRVDDFSTVVTIYASYVERLTFIRSLIDSHKGAQSNGEERRSRLRVRWNSTADGGLGRFQFEALDGVGVDRDSISLQYGSIIQGYNVIALDDFATTVYGVGKSPNHTTPYFQSATADGISTAQWGDIARANFWTDIVDSNDLLRRARDMSTRMSRVGKRIALGLRVRGIALFDGYDILDSIPVSIEDGVVSTSAYGSGYWTIWGVEYRMYDDGHDEVTFVLRPKGDGADINPELIPSNPIHYQTDFVWGTGGPTT